MPPTRLTLSAPIESVDSLELALPAGVELDDDARTITGQILPFNVDAARTSMGKPVRFMPNCLLVPQDLSRVKLLIDHDHGRPVGFALNIEQADDAATATFRVAEGSAGDLALSEASSKLRDGLSVGIDIRKGHLSADGSAYIVEQAVINEVSLCAIPAFGDARVTKITASLTNPPATPDVDGERLDDDEDQDPTDDVDDQADDDNSDKENPPMGNQQTPPATFQQAAPFQTSTTSGLTLSQAYDAIAEAIQTSSSASQVQAALADVVPANDLGKGLLPTQLTGELWTAQDVPQPYLDFAVTTKALTSIRLQGWAWNARPKVADYAGNKAEIPTNNVSTKLIEANAQRLAGGWDIDRAFVDLGDGAMVREILEMAVVDYKEKANAKARDAILAGGTAVTSTGMALDDILIDISGRAVSIGARIDYVAIAADVWATFAGLSKDAVPWWLSSGDGVALGSASGAIGSVKVFVDPALTSGQWVAGDKRATTWWSKEPPIRVQAVDLPKGGIDAGVFGYYAVKVNEPRAIWTGDTTA